MKIEQSQHSINRANWLKSPVNSGKVRPYLIDKGSLTRRLQRQSQHFSVQPLRLKQAKAVQDEAILLALKPQQHALLRDVLLVCDGVPVVFAHSVLPNQSLRGAWHGLGRLGNKPLGATLFANPKVQRTPLSFKKLSRHHALYQRIMRYQPFVHMDLPNTNLWARRSVFSLRHSSLGHAKILVTEIFLPALLKSSESLKYEHTTAD